MSFSSSPGPTAPATPTTIARRRVPAVEVREERLARRALDRLLAAEDVPAERVVAVHEVVEHAGDVVARRVEVHVHLLDDHALLAVDLLGVEARVAQHVDEHVERDVAALARAAHVVARDLLAGERVELAADRVDLRRDVARRRAPLRPLEEHVLGEVRDAVRLARLVARAGGEHDEARDRLSLLHRRGQDAQAVGQDVSFEGAHGAADGIESRMANGELTRAAMAAQPEWLRGVPTDRRFPDARLLFTGCGTSFHAAQTGGDAVQALELVLRPEREADVLVCVSHEGATALTLEAVQAWPGESWLITGKAESPLADACDEVVVCTPAIEESWCHTASYTAAVATIAALHGEDVSWLPEAVEEALAAPALPGLRPRALARRRRRPRLADRAGGGAEAARGRVRRRGGARDRAAPARLPRGGRRERARLRARRERAEAPSERTRPSRRSRRSALR